MFYVPIEMTKEYVRENEVYAAKDGEIIRITPDMIKKVIRDGVMTEVYFAEVESEEVYEEYMRSVWREEKALQRSNRCWVSNGKGKLVRCDGNCANCEHRNDNTTLSLDLFEENGGFNTYDTDARPDEILEDAELLKALWERVGELCAEDQTIIKMFGNGASEREIAEAVNLTQKGVNKRKKAIFEILKNNLKDFF